uniref:Uncharacterized protein n=1 Tax=Sus scrofa TaxID=9823 RepID=A0A8D1MC10_PIG
GVSESQIERVNLRGMGSSFLVTGRSGSRASGLVEVVMGQCFCFLKEARSCAESGKPGED